MIKLFIFFILVSCSTLKKKPEAVKVDIEPVYNSSFELKSTNTHIVNATKIADCVLSKDEFHKKIIDNGKYTHFDGDNKEIITAIKSNVKSVVRSYRKLISRASAYRKVGTNKIYINRAKLGSYEKTVRSLIHEHMHVLGFKHKGNGRNINNNAESVPYKVSTLSTPFVNGCK